MTRLRRDPRADRAACALSAGSRPRFSLGPPAAPKRPRRDPRQDFTAQRVASPFRLRLDRTQRIGSGAVTAAPKSKVDTEEARRLVTIEDPAFLVAVVPDAPGGRLTVHDRQLFGAARTLAGKTGAVIALTRGTGEDLGGVGADRTGIFVNESGDATYDPEGLASRVASAFKALAPRHLLFAETADGGDLARRVSCLVDEPLFADVEVVSPTTVARPSHGRRVEQRCAPSRLISVAPGAAAPYAGAPREGRRQTWTDDERRPGPVAIVDAVHCPADPARVPLALADFVASAGNGVTDLETFRRLVAALSATPGASRVLCDAGLMPRETQVGASGTVLAATCYFALGIAGAPQHLQGVANCEHVVAVNTDLHAAMVERAGLAVVQDAQRVMPALLAALAREAQDQR